MGTPVERVTVPQHHHQSATPMRTHKGKRKGSTPVDAITSAHYLPHVWYSPERQGYVVRRWSEIPARTVATVTVETTTLASDGSGETVESHKAVERTVSVSNGSGVLDPIGTVMGWRYLQRRGWSTDILNARTWTDRTVPAWVRQALKDEGVRVTPDRRGFTSADRAACADAAAETIMTSRSLLGGTPGGGSTPGPMSKCGDERGQTALDALPLVVMGPRSGPTV